jgi:hypothetical protein
MGVLIQKSPSRLREGLGEGVSCPLPNTPSPDPSLKGGEKKT